MNSKSFLIEKVYSLELTQRATLVAFYLINRADSEGTCFPGIKTIAKECNISTRTVQRALNDLEEVGFLVRESRFHVQGGQRSNLYYLQVLEDEQDNTQPVEDKRDKDNNVIDVSNAEPNYLNVNYSYQASINIDLPTIDFKELLEECLSRSPCHDGIP
ncbi:helix-turn-helix domain-containing protein [Alkaliphilus pronyensis]|uniref:Helix-turn-helix domain-containing protein n=1 Tax=Alkaliphilus pronyensis TaxID=1482732 RepID=A0A6I0F1Q4_9FIRM|nr:helix-turn-helix domain-containing protein [Alkaliphilus pronyensis]KAB3536278.1 helix-turn-helix domain-containing protein [Alkaliphilus pronyensis]